MTHYTVHACSLATKLVGELHGELPEVVASHLLNQGSLTLGEIIRGTGLGPAPVKQALLTLVQHNYVAAFTQRDEDGGKHARPAVVTYKANNCRIVQILRHPKFALHIRDEHGELAGAIVEVLLENGRLRLDELVTGAAAKLRREVDEARQPIQAAFMSLVQGRYVERAPPCTLPPPKILAHENTRKKKRGAKAGTVDLAAEQSLALRSYDEVRYEQQRFALPPGLLNFEGSTPATASTSGAATAAATAAAAGKEGLKRTADAAPSGPAPKKQKMKAGTTVVAESAEGASNGPSAPAGPPPRDVDAVALLWRVNNDEFNRRFRHEACVGVVASKLDKDAAAVMSAMLQLARPFETGVRDQRTSPVSEGDVERFVRAAVAQGKMEESSSEVGSVLTTLANDAMELITYVGEAGGGGYSQYCVNTGRIMDVLRSKNLETVIRDRFGVIGLRIFRLLQLKGHLEQKQISDFSMMPAKDVREMLYRMLTAGFLEVQDIPKTNDRAPSRTFQLWRMNHDAACTRVGYELYRAAGNAWLRLQHEYHKEQELTAVVRQAMVDNNVSLTDEQKRRYRRLNLLSSTMFAAMQRLDDMIAIFNDY